VAAKGEEASAGVADGRKAVGGLKARNSQLRVTGAAAAALALVHRKGATVAASVGVGSA